MRVDQIAFVVQPVLERFRTSRRETFESSVIDSSDVLDVDREASDFIGGRKIKVESFGDSKRGIENIIIIRSDDVVP